MPTYKNEKNNTWYCKFYYRDWQGVNRQKKKEGFKTQREAKAFERDFLAKQQADVTMTFETLYNLYFEYKEKRTKKKGWLIRKKSAMETNILPHFRLMRICDIEAVHIQSWQDTLLTKNFEETYLRLLHNHLSSLFNFAMKFYKLSSNPAKECGTIGKANADEMKFWTVKQFNYFIDFVKNPIVKMAFYVIFWMGLRKGECLALTKQDILFKINKISINKNFSPLEDGNIADTKTEESNRVIGMPLFLSDMLMAYINSLYDCKDNDRIFDISYQLLNYYMHSICTKQEIEPIRIHDLRHSHAALLIRLNCSIVLLSKRLGHKKVTTTLNIYGKLYQSIEDDLMNDLQKLNDEDKQIEELIAI